MAALSRALLAVGAKRSGKGFTYGGKFYGSRTALYRATKSVREGLRKTAKAEGDKKAAQVARQASKKVSTPKKTSVGGAKPESGRKVQRIQLKKRLDAAEAKLKEARSRVRMARSQNLSEARLKKLRDQARRAAADLMEARMNMARFMG